MQVMEEIAGEFLAIIVLLDIVLLILYARANENAGIKTAKSGAQEYVSLHT